MLPKYYELAVNKALKENVEESSYSDLVEVIYAELSEISIDPLNSHDYKQTSEYTWDFIDRVGNKMRVLLLPLKNDIKSAYVILNQDGNEVLVYDKDRLSDTDKEKIVDLPDERRINTIYKIIVKEILPKFLLNKRPNKISFTPVSNTRNRLVQIILSKIAKELPGLEVKLNYLIYK